MLLTNIDAGAGRSRSTGPLVELARKSFTGRLQLAPPDPPSLVAENVSVEYGAGRAMAFALEDVSVSFQPGKLALLMGPSGSGKTTLLSVLGCLVTPHRGRVTLLGHDITKLSESEKTELRRQKIGYVFQAFRLFRSLTALENILLAMELSGGNRRGGRQARQVAMDALAAVGLANKCHLLPKEMSGGEKQRVAIARALINDPPIILADEPTASLDSKSGNQVAELLLGLAEKENRLVVVVSHDNRWLPLCHRKVVLQNGSLIGDDEVRRSSIYRSGSLKTLSG
ncbi:MAG: ABC transporter ATP-binding protein [Acidobacteriota bacterium]